MKKWILVLAFALMTISSGTSAGNCDYPWQTAKDGSRCGNRAASVRPGGK